MEKNLRISIVQTDIAWGDKPNNLLRIKKILQESKDSTEIIVLPEMCTTGFCMDAQGLAEPVTGHTIQTLKEWSETYRLVLTGSFIAEDAGKYYNRAFWIAPGSRPVYYDKRHLFGIGGEDRIYSAGTRPITVAYKSWKIRLAICYDLRFPVWCRNTANEFDLLVCVANWPKARRNVWDTLLRARAMENQCYVCGVNRTGCDANNISYNGGSAILSPKGESLAMITDDCEGTATASLNLDELNRFRKRFPAWKDADNFIITD